ncbi:MAG: rplW [Rickettsiaceae bacterium]|jgi:large subunit ribosomal protein L23|nr:rplW [Rickettsiaceae bacterium]
MGAVNYDKIKGLIYTEKSNKQLEQNKYCFEVSNDCDKSEIKSLLKAIFAVDVTKVNISNVSGKIKRFKGIIGERTSYKKALVTLKEGQSINFEGLN